LLGIIVVGLLQALFKGWCCPANPKDNSRYSNSNDKLP
jgi:hypothetical protein